MQINRDTHAEIDKQANMDPQLKSSKNTLTSSLARNLDISFGNSPSSIHALLVSPFQGEITLTEDTTDIFFLAPAVKNKLAHLTSVMQDLWNSYTKKNIWLAFIKWSEISTWIDIKEYLSLTHVNKY